MFGTHLVHNSKFWSSRSEMGQSRPVRASNRSICARSALKADVESGLCRLMLPPSTLYKLPK